MNFERFAQLGVSTLYEASGRQGLIETPLERLISGSSVAGRARTVLCAQGDNLMMHAVLATVQRGEILVLTMPEPEPVALVGDLLATQAKQRGVAGMLINAAVRDSDELRRLGLPIWTRFVSSKGATRDHLGTIGQPVVVGNATICTGDLVVLDGDGAVVIAQANLSTVLAAAEQRLEREASLRSRFLVGELSVDIYNLRQKVGL
jgi:4-hydroxy-4-methyl-2-oxoglutarate aldolase